MIETPLPFSDMFKREYTMTANSLDVAIDKPGEILTDDQLKAYASTLQNLSATDRQQLKGFVAQALQDRFSNLIATLNGPEIGWVRGNDEDPLTSPEDKSVSNLAVVLANALQGKSMQRQVLKALAKGRIQLMLLRLHAMVIEYRWQNHRLPTSIEQIADPKSGLDPFTGESFHYELKDGSYRLYSTGVPGIGPLELRYRASSSVQSTNPDHP